MTLTTPIYAGIEAGGTKFVCAIGRGDGPALMARASFPTLRSPAATLAPALAWLGEQQKTRGPIAAIGIASFGPVVLDPAAPNHGYITTTPKPGWRNAPLLPMVRSAFGVPIGFDTDVNGAALAEYVWGAGRGLGSLVYITMGTGIGGGAILNGQPVHGLLHPEMGHLRLKRLPGDNFRGACYAHADCWEGLCSGPALEARAGRPAQMLPARSKVWAQTAAYTAQALHNIITVMSPQRIVIGGSVPKAGKLGTGGFFKLVRSALKQSLNGYIRAAEIMRGINTYVVPPGLGDDAGVCGAIALAVRSHAGAQR